MNPSNLIWLDHYEMDYARFQDLILSRTGLVFSENRRETLKRTLTRMAKHAGNASLEPYYADLLDHPTDSKLWSGLIKALTICETYFFRDTEQIEALRQHILPYIIARHWADHILRFWSAGCSNGEEPYTLAILLHQLLPDINRWKIFILATDINKSAIHKASLGKYREWSFRQTDEDIRQTYFIQHDGYFEIMPQIQRMVTFAYLNMAEDPYPSSNNHTNDIDLILCRNISIYWHPDVIHQVAHKLYDCLTPGGWLIVGASEPNSQHYDQFLTLNFNGANAYQKIEGVDNSPTLLSALGEVNKTPDSLLDSKSHLNSQDTFHARRKTVSQKAELAAPTIRPAQSFLAHPHQIPPIEPLSENLSLPDAPSIKPTNNVFSSAPQLRREDLLALGNEGNDYFINCQYEKARQCFSVILSVNPNDVATLNQMARLDARTGHLDEAKMWAEHSLEREPLQSGTHYLLALICQEQGDLVQAITRFKKVLYIDPNHILANIGIANLYHKTGQLTDAKRHQAHATRLVSSLAPDDILPDSDNLTAKDILISILK